LALFFQWEDAEGPQLFAKREAIEIHVHIFSQQGKLTAR